jgi:hypothetical protein
MQRLQQSQTMEPQIDRPRCHLDRRARASPFRLPERTE